MKRIISFVLCLSMLLSMLPVSVFAAEAEETAIPEETSQAAETIAGTTPILETTAAAVTTETMQEAAEFAEAETEASITESTYTCFPDMELPSDEELFAGYAEAVLYGNSISLLGTAAGSALTGDVKLAYDALVPLIREIAAGQRSSTVLSVGYTLGSGYVPDAEVAFSSTEFGQAEVDALFYALMADLPYELYWFDKTSTGGFGCSTALLGSQMYLQVSFRVSADYSLSGSTGTCSADTALTGAASSAKESAQAIVDRYAACTDYEKLVAYRDEICDLTNYNSSAASSSYSGTYGNPWQLIWVFDGLSSTKVVCEGYSKAYQYLCDLSKFENDITCYNVVGTLNGGAHMWNIVTINGSSYLVDVTNYDSGFDLFLRGGTASSSGIYTFDEQRFAYSEESTGQWGTGEGSILTLAAEDFDPDSLTTEPKETEPAETEPVETEPVETEPGETEPETGDDPSVITGEELVAILEACTDPWYELTGNVVIDSPTTLPSIPVNVYTPGTITIRSGGSLTIPGSLGVANGGMLTVESGGTMTVEGSFAMGGGSVSTIHGSLVNNGYMNIGYGSLVVNGTYTAGENAFATVDLYGSISGEGIDKSLFEISATVWEEAALAEALVPQEAYGSQCVYVVNRDLDYDGSADPVVLTKNVTIPENIEFQIGYYTGESALVRITDGITLTNNGSFFLTADGAVTVEDGASLVNNNILSNSGTITSYGIFEDHGVFSGNPVAELMSQETFLSLLETSDEIHVSRSLTLSSSVTIPAGKFVTFENPGCLEISDGAALTIEGTVNFAGSSLTVCSGSSLILRGNGHAGFMGSTALTIEEGAVYSIEDAAEIYANEGTTLTGITKAEVVNSNMLMDPDTNLQDFANQVGSGYKAFYLTIDTEYVVSQDMTLDSHILLDHAGVTVTVTNGATLTINGGWSVGADMRVYGGDLVPGHIVVENGTLVVNGPMDLLYGSSLTIGELGSVTCASSIIVDEISSLSNSGTLTVPEDGQVIVNGAASNNAAVSVAGILVINGTWSGILPEAVEDGIISGIEVADQQGLFEKMLADAAASGENAFLDYDFTLQRSLYLDCALVVGEGVTLTVPEGITLVNEGRILLMENASFVVDGKLLGNLPGFAHTSAQFEYSDDSLSFTQATLENQLANSAKTGMPVYVSIPLTLTKDLTVPQGALLMLTGKNGVLTIPTERTLTNDGTIQTMASGGITVLSTGTIANNNTILIDDQGVLDMTHGFYTCGDDGLLALCFRNEGPGTGVGAALEGSIYEHVTFLVEGWDEEQIHSVLELAKEKAPIAALQISVCGELPLTKDLILPEYASLYLSDQGYGTASLTVPEGITLSAGEVRLGYDGHLTVKSGGVLEGCIPTVTDETAEYINENSVDQAYLESLLASGYATLTAPVIITDTLEIPAGTTLTISGKGAYLALAEGAQLINSGRITVQDNGILDVTRGSYVKAGGTVSNMFRCDAEGNVTRATILGIKSIDIKFVAETASDDAVIREAIAYVSALVENGEISNPEERSFFSIRFVGDTVLSGDLELPSWSDPVIPANGTLTVPEGMTLTDHSGMAVYGSLIAEGAVIATGWPFMVDDEATLVYPENCINYYTVGKALENISVVASAPTARVGSSIQLWIDSWDPIDAEFFGSYDVAILEDTTGSAGYGWLDGNTVTVYAYSPGTVTLEVLPIIGYDYENNYESIYSEHTAVVTLNFVEENIYLYTQEDAHDFYEDGYCGLYPGSSLHFYANLTHSETDVDENLSWSFGGLSEDIGSVTLEEGVLTITAAETLTEAATFAFTVTDPSGIYADFSYEVRLRPRATAVDVALNGQAVTRKTLLFDLNRGIGSVQLAPVTMPEAAAHYGVMADGVTPLVRWSSSSAAIANVDKYGNVTFTGKTGKVKITMTANFGTAKAMTASVTFNVAALAQTITSSENNATTLIGGSSASYTVTDDTGTALKSSAVKWFLSDKDGQPIASHPYASITAAGKLTTKTVADETKVYLMAQVVGDENSACLNQPLLVTLYPAISHVQILDAIAESVNGKTLLYDVGRLGLYYPLSWTAAPYPESVKSVSWKSSKTSVAAIDENGLITVSGPEASGTVKFTLTVTALNGKKTTAAFTMKFGTFTQDLYLSAIMPDGEEVYDLANLPEESTLTIFSGESITFSAGNYPDTVTTPGVKWSLDNKTYATISSKGVLKAKTVNNPVIITVLVESKDGGCGYEIPVVILPKQDAVVIWNEDEEFITKTTRTLEVGSQLRLNASEAVTWTSSKPSVASVDETGCVTALAKGTATITAATSDGRKATVTVKVNKLSCGVTISTKNGEAFTVASGKSLTLVGTVEYPDGTTDTKVTWSVSDTSLATITSSGKLTAAKNLTRPAEVRVYATTKDGNWYTWKTVQLLPITTAVEIFGTFGSRYPADVSNTTQKWDLQEGNTFSLSARTFPEGAMDAVTWKSSSTKIATVDPDGNVTCLKAGTVTITATAADGSGKKASFKLTVHKTMDKGSLKLPETAFIAGGKSLTLTGLKNYHIDDTATTKTLTWTLAYPNGAAVPKTVATLSGGVLKTKAVTAPIKLYITAAATDGSGERAQCTVTVYPAIKGITLYNLDMESVNNKTVPVPVNEGFTFLPDATNVKGYGSRDDKTADEFLPGGTAWTVTVSKDIAEVFFDGQTLTVYAIGAPIGQSVKITLKANDGSGKSAYFTIRFTEASPQ